MTGEQVPGLGEPVAWHYDYEDPAGGQVFSQTRWPTLAPGWTEQPLYTAAQVQAAVDAERDAVVAWLRRAASSVTPAGFYPEAKAYADGREDSYDLAADSIQGNEHRPDAP